MIEFLKKLLTKRVAIGALAVVLTAAGINPAWREPILACASPAYDLIASKAPLKEQPAPAEPEKKENGQ